MIKSKNYAVKITVITAGINLARLDFKFRKNFMKYNTELVPFTELVSSKITCRFFKIYNLAMQNSN